MNLNLYPGYPDRIGKRFAFAGWGIGPTSYNTTTKDPIALPGFQNYIDVLHGAITVSGTYQLRAIPSGKGPRATWKLVWVTASTQTEVTAATNLSGETVILGGLGGVY